MSVPESMAGKKGKCPTCGKPLVAPASSTVTPAVKAPAAKAAAAAAPAKAETSPSKADTFAVASSDLTGSKDVVVSGDETEEAAAAKKPATGKSASMRFKCPKCSKTLTVPLSLAGKTGKCAGCNNSFTAPVPELLKQARAKAAARNAAPPSLRDAFSIVKVRCVCGMTSSVPKARAQSGTEKCPACDRVLELEGEAAE
jgi:hypothetical protein